MQTVTVTSKFQVHIPVAIRKKIGLTEPTQANIYTKNKKIIIEPRKSSILELSGKLHKYYKKNPVNIDRIRDYIDYSDI